MSRPFCSDCMNYSKHGDAANDLCKSLAAMESGIPTNYIRRVEPVVPLRCVTMRLVGGKCGLEGKLFAPNELFPPRQDVGR